MHNSAGGIKADACRQMVNFDDWRLSYVSLCWLFHSISCMYTHRWISLKQASAFQQLSLSHGLHEAEATFYSDLLHVHTKKYEVEDEVDTEDNLTRCMCQIAHTGADGGVHKMFHVMELIMYVAN